MPIPTGSIIDFLFKKVAYGVTRTTSGKDYSNETQSSPAVISANNLWLDEIPSNPTNTYPLQKIFLSGIRDATSPLNTVWTTNIKDWISPSYGNAYVSELKVIIDVSGKNSGNIARNASSAFGTGIIFPANDANAGGDFIFDYNAGVLHFTQPQSIPANFDKHIYIEGYRYIGKKGQSASGQLVLNSGSTLIDTTFNGTATFNGPLTAKTGTFDLIQTTGLNILGDNIVDNQPARIGMWNIDLVAGNILNLMARRNDLTISTSGENYVASNTPPSGGSINLSAHSGINLYARNNQHILLSGNNINISGQARFNNIPTVNNTGVSLSGHKHVYNDVTDFCSGVASCVTTELVSSTGIQFTSGNDFLRISLSGQALSLHNLSTTGLFVRSTNGNIIHRVLQSGANIFISNNDGGEGNPTISLTSSVTGLSDITVKDIEIKNNTISSLASNSLIINNNANRVGLRNTNPQYDVDISGDLRVTNDLYVNNNLIITGNTVIGNVSTMHIEDPTIRLGSASGEAFAYDTMDRGIEFVYATGAGSPTVQITGFFGWKNETWTCASGSCDPNSPITIPGRFVVLERVTGIVNNNDYSGRLGHFQAGRIQADTGWLTNIAGTSGSWTLTDGTLSAKTGYFDSIWAGTVNTFSTNSVLRVSGSLYAEKLSVTGTNITASNLAIFDGNRFLVSTGVPSLIELGYLSGVTGNIQTQITNIGGDNVKITGTQNIGGTKTFTENTTKFLMGAVDLDIAPIQFSRTSSNTAPVKSNSTMIFGTSPVVGNIIDSGPSNTITFAPNATLTTLWNGHRIVLGSGLSLGSGWNAIGIEGGSSPVSNNYNTFISTTSGNYISLYSGPNLITRFSANGISGTWDGNTIPINKGGTNTTSLNAGILFTDSTTFSSLSQHDSNGATSLTSGSIVIRNRNNNGYAWTNSLYNITIDGGIY